MPYSILYIEDNADNMQLVKRALEARGYVFYWAENGRTGLELAFQNKPNVILLDINLPDIDGYAVARELRKGSAKFSLYTPIIAVTANALQGDAEKALEAGCDIYMSKPINIRELWARIETFLPIRRE
jgi:two-component system, cell cycle response regulator DivK